MAEVVAVVLAGAWLVSLWRGWPGHVHHRWHKRLHWRWRRESLGVAGSEDGTYPWQWRLGCPPGAQLHGGGAGLHPTCVAGLALAKLGAAAGGVALVAAVVWLPSWAVAVPLCGAVAAGAWRAARGSWLRRRHWLAVMPLASALANVLRWPAFEIADVIVREAGEVTGVLLPTWWKGTRMGGAADADRERFTEIVQAVIPGALVEFELAAQPRMAVIGSDRLPAPGTVNWDDLLAEITGGTNVQRPG